jgi:hypothetical protein
MMRKTFAGARMEKTIFPYLEDACSVRHHRIAGKQVFLASSRELPGKSPETARLHRPG